MNLHDPVVLIEDLPGTPFRPGDAGTIIHIHPDHAAFDIEFASLTGQTRGIARALPHQFQPAHSRDPNQVREILPP